MVPPVTGHVHVLFCLMLSFVASTVVGEKAERNRVRVEQIPGCSISLNTTAEAVDVTRTVEQWSIALKPTIAVEFAIGQLFVAGISLPGVIEMTHTRYGASAFDGEVAIPSFELAVAGGSGEARYRLGLYSSPPAGSDFAIGTTVLLAVIRDPVALKYSGRIEIGTGQYDRGFRPRAGGCSLALMTVLNEVVAVELGISVDLYSGIGTRVFPPVLFGSTGIYIRKENFTFSVSSRWNIWSRLKPASIIMSIGWSTI